MNPDSHDLTRLFDLSVDALCVLSPEGRIVVRNSAFQAGFGYTDQWLVEHTVFDMVHPDDQARVAVELEGVGRGETTVLFESRSLTASGEVRWFQWSARMDPVTGRIYASGRDVSNMHIDHERLERYARQLERAHKDLKDALDELTTVANTDQLTGLLNRRAFEARAMEELSRAQRSGHSLGLALLDIDRFKAVNDTYGHPTGDVVLREVARRLDTTRRLPDVVCRWGGEEFMVLFPESTLQDAQTATDRLALSIAALPVTVGSLDIPVRISGGVTAARGSEISSLSELEAAADHALRRAKENGRDRVEVQSPAEWPVAG